MSCKNYEELIDGFLDNSLEGYEAVLMQHHLKGCHRCKERLKRAISVVALIKSEIAGIQGPQPGEEFSRKVLCAIGLADSNSIGSKEAPQSLLAPFWAALRKPLVAASLVAAVALLIFSVLFIASGQQKRFLTVYELAAEKGQTRISADDGIDHFINEHLYRYSQSSLVIDREMIVRLSAAK